MSKAYTKEEVREKFLTNLRELAKYWANVQGRSIEEKCDGLAFSILNIFDGTTMGLPAMNITLCPHPDDQEYLKSKNKNWYEPEMCINDDVMLHDHYYKEKT